LDGCWARCCAHSAAWQILPAGQTREIIDLCWRAETLADAGDIARKAGKA
jgi:hypothetical protein